MTAGPGGSRWDSCHVPKAWICCSTTELRTGADQFPKRLPRILSRVQVWMEQKAAVLQETEREPLTETTPLHSYRKRHGLFKAVTGFASSDDISHMTKCTAKTRSQALRWAWRALDTNPAHKRKRGRKTNQKKERRQERGRQQTPASRLASCQQEHEGTIPGLEARGHAEAGYPGGGVRP